VTLVLRDLRHRLDARGHLRAGETFREDDAELVQLAQRRRLRRVVRPSAPGDNGDDGYCREEPAHSR
jgi:hypothetical protein